MEILKTIKQGAVKLQFVDIEGHKFRLHYEQQERCSSPSHFRADVLTKENGWVAVAGKEDIAFEVAKSGNPHTHEENATEFFTAMRYHLKMLYS